MRRHSGLTLVELLVAMVLVLVVLAGSTAFVARGRAAHRTGESLAQLEETLDAAFTVLVDEIRIAGYLGLAAPGTPVQGASTVGSPEPAGLAVAGGCGESLAHDLASPIVASDAAFEAAPGHPVRCRPGPAGRVATNADVLIVRHAAPESSPPSPGRLQLESNLRAAALSAAGAGVLGAEARWHDLEVGVYYVSADSTGRAGWPSLRRKRLIGGARPAFQDEELVAGIADMQVETGLEGGTPTVRIELEARSDVPDHAAPDAQRRKRISRIVKLRNHGTAP
jgi:type IV pilus assembly protein PilW